MIPTIFKTDAYKLHHQQQYPKNTQYLYSNLTPRDFSKFKVHCVGDKIPEKIWISNNLLQYLIEQLKKEWKQNFFDLDWDNQLLLMIQEFEQISQIDLTTLIDSYYELWKLKKLPLKFEILSDCYIEKNTPVLTIINTDPKFYWLVTYIESWILAEYWMMLVNDNIAKNLFDLLEEHALKTGDLNKLKFQVHDFSYRGMSSTNSALKSGLCHLNHFLGTDNIQSIYEWKQNEHVLGQRNLIGTSIVATEHSVMSAGTKEKEFETYQKLLELYPNQPLAIVSDTWDYFNVLDTYLMKLKPQIMQRKFPLIIRPDSGNPLEIVCGTKLINPTTSEEFGSIRLLDKIFSSKVNDKGYKEIDEHISLIYGDGMNINLIHEILTKMEEMNYASTNINFGVGSQVYQQNNRDELAIAMKCTAICINGQWSYLEKNPKTDSGTKKSRKGFINVYLDKSVSKILVEDQIQSLEEYENNKKTHSTLWNEIILG